jgi:hypothetical protein
MISFEFSGSFDATESFLKKLQKTDIAAILNANGQLGVSALALATPVETGLAADSWAYEVSSANGVYTITWINTDIENDFPVAIMLQYGYGTGTGGYVQGRDYINPAMKPVFDEIENNVWKAVTSV